MRGHPKRVNTGCRAISSLLQDTKMMAQKKRGRVKFPRFKMLLEMYNYGRPDLGPFPLPEEPDGCLAVVVSSSLSLSSFTKSSSEVSSPSPVLPPEVELCSMSGSPLASRVPSIARLTPSSWSESSFTVARACCASTDGSSFGQCSLSSNFSHEVTKPSARTQSMIRDVFMFFN